jgi:hypothetical protein
VERFGCRPVKQNHVECYDRATTTLLQARFPVRHANWPPRFVLVNLPFAVRILKTPTIVGDADSDQEAAAKLSAIQMQY